MRKLFAVIAVALLVSAFMLPAQAEGNTKVLFTFEDGLDGALANGWDGGENITFTQVATTDLVGNGAIKIHTDDVIGLADTWSGIDFVVDPAEVAQYTGICVRMDARSITDYEKDTDQITSFFWGLVKPGSSMPIFENIKFIDIYGQDVTPTGVDSEGEPKRTVFDEGSCYCFLPQDFNGWIFTDVAAKNLTDLSERTGMVLGLCDWPFDAQYDTSNKDIYIDQFALYKGTDYKAIITELGGVLYTPIPAVTTPVPVVSPTPTANIKEGFPWLYVGIGTAAAVVIIIAVILISRKKK